MTTNAKASVHQHDYSQQQSKQQRSTAAGSSSPEHQMKSKYQNKVKSLPGNLYCCDCGKNDPDWASITFGILFCLQCSGIHRYVK